MKGQFTLGELDPERAREGVSTAEIASVDLDDDMDRLSRCKAVGCGCPGALFTGGQNLIVRPVVHLEGDVRATVGVGGVQRIVEFQRLGIGIVVGDVECVRLVTASGITNLEVRVSVGASGALVCENDELTTDTALSTSENRNVYLNNHLPYGEGT